MENIKVNLPIYKKNIGLNLEQLKKIQLDSLKVLIFESKKYCQYYGEKFSDISDDFIRDAKTVSEILDKFPFLEKHQIKREYE